jgi:hypothetical protein
MDAKIMDGANYKALDLLGDMRKGFGKRQCGNAVIYRRNLQRATSKEWTT